MRPVVQALLVVKAASVIPQELVLLLQLQTGNIQTKTENIQIKTENIQTKNREHSDQNREHSILPYTLTTLAFRVRVALATLGMRLRHQQTNERTKKLLVVQIYRTVFLSYCFILKLS
jgi:hypothetical protein